MRVHLDAHGNTLLVDPVYGGNKEFFVSDVKGKQRFNLEKGTEERPLLTRTPLHAHQLIFTDPFDGEERTFEVEIPKDKIGRASCRERAKSEEMSREVR